MDSTIAQAGTSDYLDAFRSVRLAKNLCWIAVFLALATQVFGFVMVSFVGKIDAAPSLGIDYGVVVAPTAPYSPETVEQAEAWYQVLYWLMPTAKFVGLVAAMLLSLTLLLALKLSLLGRLSGVAGFVRAFFWSLILLAMVIPWQQFPAESSFASGVLCSLGYVVRHTQKMLALWGGPQSVELLDQILYYGRFLAYPGIALLIWLTIHLKFAKGLRMVKARANALASGPASQSQPTHAETPEAGE